MSVRAWRRWSRRVSWRGAACAALLLLLAAALLPASLPPPLLTTARFPHLAPSKLAHMLADFSTHIVLYPHLGEWSVEEESGNYSAWRYSVRYSCGARCSGRARVLALERHAPPAPAHAPPPAHTVLVTHRSCTSLPLLSMLAICDEWETESTVRGDGAGGAELRESARAWCAVPRRLLPAAAPLSCAAELRAHRHAHLQRLRAILRGVGS